MEFHRIQIQFKLNFFPIFKNISIFTGPCESVRNNETGYLVDQTAEAFSSKMAELLENEQKWMELSEEGPKWVQKVFAFDAFARKLDEIVVSVI